MKASKNQPLTPLIHSITLRLLPLLIKIKKPSVLLWIRKSDKPQRSWVSFSEVSLFLTQFRDLKWCLSVRRKNSFSFGKVLLSTCKEIADHSTSGRLRGKVPGFITWQLSDAFSFNVSIWFHSGPQASYKAALSQGQRYSSPHDLLSPDTPSVSLLRETQRRSKGGI